MREVNLFIKTTEHIIYPPTHNAICPGAGKSSGQAVTAISAKVAPASVSASTCVPILVTPVSSGPPCPAVFLALFLTLSGTDAEGCSRDRSSWDTHQKPSLQLRFSTLRAALLILLPVIAEFNPGYPTQKVLRAMGLTFLKGFDLPAPPGQCHSGLVRGFEKETSNTQICRVPSPLETSFHILQEEIFSVP